MPTWNAALAVGHPVIDEQHRELFARADDLIDAMMRGKAGAEMQGLFGFLRDYCRDHFATEERLMASARYPGAADHAALHREFTRQFQELEELMDTKGASALVVLGTKDLIRGWLVNHVGTVDQQLSAFLRAPPARPAARG